MRAIKILPLGVSGAGKSAYLSSLYEKLRFQNSDTCYSLKTDEEFARDLNEIYRNLSDPKKPWMPGSLIGDYKEYNFDCIVDTKNGSFDLMKLSYLDFPGGMLTDRTDDERFFARFRETDAFLILIDGAEILSAFNGDQEALKRMNASIDILISPLQKHLSKPLHVVITKWDVLENRHNLQEVGDLLKKNRAFSALVSLRSGMDCKTHLIPISSLGSGFATMDQDGRMLKNEGVKSVPYNVDLPISCLISDIVERTSSNIRNDRNSSFWTRLWDRVVGSGPFFSSIGRALGEFMPTLPGGVFVKAIVDLLIEGVSVTTAEAMKIYKEQFGEGALNSATREEAFRYFISHHALELYWMRRVHPGSTL